MDEEGPALDEDEERWAVFATACEAEGGQSIRGLQSAAAQTAAAQTAAAQTATDHSLGVQLPAAQAQTTAGTAEAAKPKVAQAIAVPLPANAAAAVDGPALAMHLPAAGGALRPSSSPAACLGCTTPRAPSAAALARREASVGLSGAGASSSSSSSAAQSVAAPLQSPAVVASPPSGTVASAHDVALRLQILDGTGTERRVDVHFPSGATVADLKAREFREETARGWLPRCIYRGRALADEEQLSCLPPDSFLQCYLQRPQARAAISSVAAAEHEFFLAWTRMATSGQHGSQSTLGSKWQDLAFHAFIALCLSLAWGAYMTDSRSFDFFGRFALLFFSAVWAFVCFADFSRRRGSAATVAAASSSAADRRRPRHIMSASEPRQRRPPPAQRAEREGRAAVEVGADAPVGLNS